MDATKTVKEETKSTSPEAKPINVGQQLSVAAMNLQIPQYWPESPKLWFKQFEAYMSLQQEDDKSKYHLVISKLDKESIEAVSDLLFDPPRTGKYEALKNRLLSASDEKRFVKILNDMETSRMSHLISEQINVLHRIETLLTQFCETNRPESSSSRYRNDGWVCWYHRKFGVESTKCADEFRCTFY